MTLAVPDASGGVPVRGCAYQVIVCDEPSPSLTEHDGSRYESPPQPRHQALALVRALLELPQAPEGNRPWRRARPGGQRTVKLQPEQSQ